MRRGEILGNAVRTEMLNDQLGTTPIQNSPAASKATSGDTALVCGSSARTRRVKSVPYFSSPGAYGAYPFMASDLSYSGILARQGQLGTFPQGIALAAEVRALSEAWTACETLRQHVIENRRLAGNPQPPSDGAQA